MIRFATPFILAAFLAMGGYQTTATQEKPAAPVDSKAEKETRYLAFQIFTYGPDPKVARLGEGKTEVTLLERLPPKIQKIQKDLPAWVEKSGNKDKATTLMQKLEAHLKARNFEEAEKTADSILKMIGESR